MESSSCCLMLRQIVAFFENKATSNVVQGTYRIRQNLKKVQNCTVLLDSVESLLKSFVKPPFIISRIKIFVKTSIVLLFFGAR